MPGRWMKSPVGCQHRFAVELPRVQSSSSLLPRLTGMGCWDLTSPVRSHHYEKLWALDSAEWAEASPGTR